MVVDDDDAYGYDRQLDDDELVQLAALVDRRMKTLLARGVPVPISQIENHHMVGLLEVFVGRAKALRVKEWHLTWVDRRLDDIEDEVRRIDLLNAGILGGGQAPEDVPGFP